MEENEDRGKKRKILGGRRRCGEEKNLRELQTGAGR